MTRRSWLRILVPVFALALVAAACGSDSKSNSSSGDSGGTKRPSLSGTLNASGATFPQAFYEECIAKYKKVQPNVTVNYGGGGSGKGRTDLQNKLVDWAGSDGIESQANFSKYQGGPFLYVPTVAAPVTVSYNVPSLSKLQLSGDTIAKIFQRQIKTWDDAAIKADNPGVTLPSTPIVVARRADGSGTTQNFTLFLTKAAPTAWTLGSASTVNWPADTQAGQGNGGVAQIVKSQAGAIGYVDFSDARASGLKFASIKNSAGKYIEPNIEGVKAAVAGATINADLTYDPLFAPGEKTYPIAAPTWIFAYATTVDATKAPLLKDFLNYVVTDCQKIAESVDYAPLPSSLASKSVAAVASIKP